MKKFIAIFKTEYRKIVLKKSFWLSTLLFPIVSSLFVIVPTLMFSIKGEPTRMVIVDRSGKLAGRIKANLSPKALEKTAQGAKKKADEVLATGKRKVQMDDAEVSVPISFVDYDYEQKTDEVVQNELEGEVSQDKIDAYILLPPDVTSPNSNVSLYSRRATDFIQNSVIENAVNQAVRSQRLADANISETEVLALSTNVNFSSTKLDKKGEATDDGSGFWAGFIVAFMIYLSLQIYGQMVLASVVEEKETKVSEILFSSAKPTQLLLGKLVGSAAAGLTQMTVWLVSLSVALAFGVGYFSAMGIGIKLPSISVVAFALLLVFFLIGFFIYSAVYALIGSMVSTVQEGGQFSLIPVMLMLVGFYLSFAVIRDPNSSLAFWSSILPFTAPLTMPVRIVAEMPPFWQIALSIGLNLAVTGLLVWIAARVYRVGMLMYGKRATIPEVWKWIRQP